MHIMSSHNHSEFLACPQLIRFDFAEGRDRFEPTFLIKASTLLLKYVILGAPMQLAFCMWNGRLVYALRICDDGDSGGVLWSVAEREEELKCIRSLSLGEPLVAFLFNELAINVAWSGLTTSLSSQTLSDWVDAAVLGPADYSEIKTATRSLFDQLHENVESEAWLKWDVGGISDWKAVKNNLITAGASSSLIDIFDSNEGNQQEQIGLWLTDNLQPTGAYSSPQIPKGAGRRELIDIALSHSFGAVLIESKTLSILQRERLPNRAKLRRDTSAHIAKAFTQLRGAIKALKSGVSVTSPQGSTLIVEREKPIHAIVLIPDLELVDDPSEFGIEFIRDFMTATGGFAHLLDISELLRVVQAAEMISARGNSTTPMMAFDYYLIQRAEKAVEAGTLCIEVLLRFVEDDMISD